MGEREPIRLEDDDIARLLRTANEDLPEHAFVAAVLHRARRRQNVRMLVLSAAGAVAVLIAIGPLLDLARLAQFAAPQWYDADWYRQNALLLGAAVATVAWPLLARWLAR